MRKTLENIIKALKALTVCVSNKTCDQDQVMRELAAITLLLEDVLRLNDDMSLESIQAMKEKIDFLIFMQAKNVKIGPGGVTLIPGETLFKQWQESKNQKADAFKKGMKPLPSEENPI